MTNECNGLCFCRQHTRRRAALATLLLLRFVVNKVPGTVFIIIVCSPSTKIDSSFDTSEAASTRLAAYSVITSLVSPASSL
jgi:hypothetical protein